jgi:hypothetical protein
VGPPWRAGLAKTVKLRMSNAEHRKLEVLPNAEGLTVSEFLRRKKPRESSYGQASTPERRSFRGEGGVPQKTARTISGHKTDALFSRYNIVSDADIRNAARKIEEGAKVAVSGSIHSSFIVGPESESASDDKKERKPF